MQLKPADHLRLLADCEMHPQVPEHDGQYDRDIRPDERHRAESKSDQICNDEPQKEPERPCDEILRTHGRQRLFHPRCQCEKAGNQVGRYSAAHDSS